VVMPKAESLRVNLTADFDVPDVMRRNDVEGWVQNGGIDYLVLDPLYAVMGGADISDRTNEVVGVLNWLSRLQAEHGCATIFSTLMGKESLHIRDMFGSKFLRHWLECALLTRRRSRAEYEEFTLRCYAERDDYGKRTQVLRGTGIGTWALRTQADGDDEIETVSEVERRQLKAAEDRERVSEHMEAFPDATVAERVDALSLSKRTIERHMSAIRKDGPA
jgi:hypothetical protein